MPPLPNGETRPAPRPWGAGLSFIYIMRTKFETDTVTLPAYLACYLVNGDASGIDDSERFAADEYTAGLARDGWDIGCPDGEPEFSHRCDMPGQLAGDMLEFPILREIPAGKTLESALFGLLESAGIRLGDAVRVVAYELTHDGLGWSVNTPFCIASETRGLSALEVMRGRWDVFRANYAARARVSDLADISETDGTAEFEVDGVAFLRVERLEGGEA